MPRNTSGGGKIGKELEFEPLPETLGWEKRRSVINISGATWLMGPFKAALGFRNFEKPEILCNSHFLLRKAVHCY